MATAKTRTVAEIDNEIAATKAALANVRGSETEVYARIVGYYRAVRNWNKGKREEYDHRKMFKLSDSKTYEISGADEACESCAPVRVTQPRAKAMPASSSERYELFARKTCPNCPPVKAYMANVAMAGTTIDVDTEAGLADAAKKGVFASPTVIVYGADGMEVARGHNVEELEAIFEPVAARA